MSNEPVLQVTMPDGSVWAIPISIIARNRSERYEDETSAYFKALNDDDLLVDWASNNMHWYEVEYYAKQIKPPEPKKYNGAWPNAEKKIVR